MLRAELTAPTPIHHVGGLRALGVRGANDARRAC
jgi:hypothetical protein